MFKPTNDLKKFVDFCDANLLGTTLTFTEETDIEDHVHEVYTCLNICDRYKFDFDCHDTLMNISIPEFICPTEHTSVEVDKLLETLAISIPDTHSHMVIKLSANISERSLHMEISEHIFEHVEHTYKGFNY